MPDDGERIDLSPLQAATARVQGELHELDERIAAVRQERDEIEAAPLPPDDFAALIVETIEAAAGGYAERLHADLQKYLEPSAFTAPHAATALAGSALCTGQPPALPMGGTSLEGKGLSLPAIWFYLGDLIKPKLVEAIAAMPDYPSPVGLPRAARAAKLRELEQQLQALQVDRERIRRELRAADVAGLAAAGQRTDLGSLVRRAAG